MDEPGLSGLSVLIVEDEVLLRKQITAELERLGAEVAGAGSVAQTRRWLGEQEFDFVLLDVNLPDGSGMELLGKKVFPESTGVIVMTAHGGVAGAVEAMRLGALDYLVKPFEMGELSLVVARAQRARRSDRLAEHQRGEIEGMGGEFFFGSALGDLEKQIQKILAADERMGTGLSPVLIQGETGTGKTAVARLMHQQGHRAKGPLVEMNCAAVPETLAESELFGHERGAFTDARSARMGLFEAADGGTLFLDELPSLSPSLQVKLLKAIEDRRIRRLGGTREIPVDARVIAASPVDLRQLAAEGKFREDLFHRLDLFRVNILPLRERGEDIIKLAEVLIKRLTQKHRVPARKISAEGRRRLLGYSWPGNVRELAHELERAIVFEEGDTLSFARLVRGGDVSSAVDPNDWFNVNYRFPEEGFSLEEGINRIIQHALKQTDHNVSAAARLLGVTRDYLRYHLSEQKRKKRDTKAEG